MRSGIDIGGLCCSRHFGSSQRCSVGLSSGFRAGHSSSSTPALVNHVFMELAFCMVWQQFGEEAHTGVIIRCPHEKLNTTSYHSSDVQTVTARFTGKSFFFSGRGLLHRRPEPLVSLCPSQWLDLHPQTCSEPPGLPH